MSFSDFNNSYNRLTQRLKTCLTKNAEENIIAPLSSNCKAGKKKICKITGDRKLCARMASLGVYPGKEIELICAHNGSQCILKVHGGTVSIDNSTSEKILVESI